MTEQCHIASLLVHVRPQASQPLLDYLAARPGTEVHAASPEGKLVLVLERDRAQGITEALEEITGQPGVLSCALIYHETMTVSESEQLLIASEKSPAA